MFIHDCEFRTVKNIEEKFKKFCCFAENSIRNDKYNYGSDIFEFRKGKNMFDGFIYYQDFPVMYFDFYKRRFEILTMSNDVKNFAHYKLQFVISDAEQKHIKFYNLTKKKHTIKNIINEHHLTAMNDISMYNEISLMASKVFFKCLNDFLKEDIECILNKTEISKESLDLAFNNINLDKFLVVYYNTTKDIIDYLYELILKVKPL